MTTVNIHEAKTDFSKLLKRVMSVDLVAYVCEAETVSLCLIEQVGLLLPIEVADSGESTV